MEPLLSGPERDQKALKFAELLPEDISPDGPTQLDPSDEMTEGIRFYSDPMDPFLLRCQQGSPHSCKGIQERLSRGQSVFFDRLAYEEARKARHEAVPVLHRQFALVVRVDVPSTIVICLPETSVSSVESRLFKQPLLASG